jgi:phosphocarrier protein HPr
MNGCEVRVARDGHSAAGGSILGLMMLGAAKGDTVELSVKGAEAEERLAELVAMIEDGFGED